ncbi:MAG: RhuM family protein [Verrucomicrobiota bacterium]|jgi:hypothetical protein
MDAPKSEIILYQTEDNQTRVQVRLEGETVWLTQAQMAELFQRERSVITKHIRNIFEEGELAEPAVCANFAQTAAKPHMGLTAWLGSRPRKADAMVAKNYLDLDEIQNLNLIVSLYLDFGELQARGRKPMYMRDWIAKLDEFLRLSDREIQLDAIRSVVDVFAGQTLTRASLQWQSDAPCGGQGQGPPKASRSTEPFPLPQGEGKGEGFVPPMVVVADAPEQTRAPVALEALRRRISRFPQGMKAKPTCPP